MHGKVWMFSNLIDDEDIEFMQHEFISYKQAMHLKIILSKYWMMKRWQI